MYTLYGLEKGCVRTASRSSRISSIPRLDAASISRISSSLHPISRAKILATVVFPVPRPPQN